MTDQDRFSAIAQCLIDANVRFVVIGVSGVNYYASSSAEVFHTYDRDLLLPLDPKNLLRAWRVCQERGLELLSGHEPLDRPRDDMLAQAVVQRAALTRASDGAGLDLDLTLVMTGFDFETVWRDRQIFLVDGTEIPVARLTHIVESKALAGRKKDLLFLETHKEALRQLLGEEPD